MAQSVYIHIPFCKKKCKYCSFISFETLDKKKGYLYSLLKEIDYYYQNESLKTLYVGGGTPSLMSVEDLKLILSKFEFETDAEITIELNPNDITQDYANGLKSIGFNRVSLGVQSFDDSMLQLIGRRHSSDEVYSAIGFLKNAGFQNVSIDLIYGLPNQTLSGFESDLRKGLSLNIQHISLYGLKIDEGSYFYNHYPENLPDDDLQADMYLLANRVIKEHGFEHYEVSNYSLDGYGSRHNSNYWECGEYYGFGVSAHGFENGVRYSNYSTLAEYMNNPVSREFGKFLTSQERLEEKIFLGLRLEKGINVSEINQEFGIDFDERYREVLKKYLETGHFIKTDCGYKFNNDEVNNGFLVSNLILSEFMS
jgi:oxygen-independent coproporphyrinogen-3 oxidase